MNRLFTLILSVAIVSQTLYAATPLLKKNQIIVCLGNSITEQGEQPDGYVSLMRKALQVIHPELNTTIVNSGIGGQKAPDMAARFQRDVLDYHPDWVTVSVGINDVWHGFYDNHPAGDGPRGVPLKTYVEKVTEMVRVAKAHNARVVLFTTTVIKEDLSSPENQKLAAYNDALRKIAKKNGCILADQNAAFVDSLTPYQKPGMSPAGLFTVDGVHMLPSGNRVMARVALGAFGIADSVFNNAWPGIESLVNAEKTNELPPLDEDEKRLLIVGSPNKRWLLTWDVDDHVLRSECHSGESMAQIAARMKHSLALNAPTHVMVFLDGIEWFGNAKTSAATKQSFGRIAQIANASKVVMSVVVPCAEKTIPKVLSWMLDTCQWYGVTILRNTRREIAGYIADTIEVSPVAISSGGLFAGKAVIRIQPILEAGPIHFTLDNSVPSVASPVYAGPITIDETTVLSAETFWRSEQTEVMVPLAKPPISQALKIKTPKGVKKGAKSIPKSILNVPKRGRKFAVPPPPVEYETDSASGVRREGWKKVEPQPAQYLLSSSPGLKFTYHEGTWETMPVFDTMAVVREGIAAVPDLVSVQHRDEQWGVVFNGFIDVPETGMYTFFLVSDDGSMLFIDNKLIADNDGIHGIDEKSGQAALAKGKHPLKIEFFQNAGGAALSLYWKGPGLTKQKIVAEYFYH